MISDSNDKDSASARARARRVRLFAAALDGIYTRRGAARGLRILDIGGTIGFWRMNAAYIPSHLVREIEVVNLPPIKEQDVRIDGLRIISYEGNALDARSLRSDHYDVVHSNSVIEHVGNLSAQKAFGDNVRALGDYHFIQTPCRTFPIEPHFYFPFYALFPLSVRGFLHRHLNLGFVGREKDWLLSRIRCEETRLLTRNELAHIFPESECLAERMFLMVKSWMVTNMRNHERGSR